MSNGKEPKDFVEGVVEVGVCIAACTLELAAYVCQQAAETAVVYTRFAGFLVVGTVDYIGDAFKNDEVDG